MISKLEDYHHDMLIPAGRRISRIIPRAQQPRRAFFSNPSTNLPSEGWIMECVVPMTALAQPMIPISGCWLVAYVIALPACPNILEHPCAYTQQAQCRDAIPGDCCRQPGGFGDFGRHWSSLFISGSPPGFGAFSFFAAQGSRQQCAVSNPCLWHFVSCR